MSLRLVHVVNPFEAAEASAAARMQEQTLESMLYARGLATENVRADFLATVFENESPAIPSGFEIAKLLTRSVRDEAAYANKKKLPFIADILQAALQNSDAPYILYTNMDIVLQPYFYNALHELLITNLDALVINRRGIDMQYANAGMSVIYAAVGHPHPGFDCFVMKRELVQQFVLGAISIGIPFLEVALLHNIIAYAKNWRLVDDLHLTTHLGREVMPPYDHDLYLRNRSEYERNIFPVLKPHLRIEQFPYAALPFHKRVMKWMLNPSIRTKVVLEMEGQSLLRRLKFRLDEVRFRWLQNIK